MTTTITSSTGVVMAPLLSITPSSTAAAQNQLLPIIGRALPDVLLRPAGPRTGTLQLLFDDWTAANAAYGAHRASALFTLVDTVQPELDLTYACAGNITLEVVEDTLEHWILSVEFSEVAA